MRVEAVAMRPNNDYCTICRTPLIVSYIGVAWWDGKKPNFSLKQVQPGMFFSEEVEIPFESIQLYCPECGLLYAHVTLDE